MRPKLSSEAIEAIEEMLSRAVQASPDGFAQVWMTIHLEPVGEGRSVVRQLSLNPVPGMTVRLPRSKRG